MAKESVIITATKSGKTIQKSLTDMNPEATNAQLATFGTMLNALTTNTYQKTDRITKVNCDTEPGGGTKPTPTITLNPSTIALSGISENDRTLVSTSTTSDGQIYVRPMNPDVNSNVVYAAMNGTSIALRKLTGASGARTFYVGVTETDSYKGVEVEFTVTA